MEPTYESLSFADLLPIQWRDIHLPSEQPPMNRLFLAVLEDALRCWQVHQSARSQSRQRLFFEADLWLFHPEIIAPFTFEEVCEVLDIEPDYLRGGLKHWREAALEGRPEAKILRRKPHARSVPQLNPTRPRDRSNWNDHRKNLRRDNGHHPHGGMREVKKTSPYSPLTGHQE